MTKVIPPAKVFSQAEIKRRLKERLLSPKGEMLPKKPRRARRTIVTSVSILPELVIRVKRDLGEGSFSRGVVKACTRALMELDQERLEGRKYRGE